MYEYDKCHNSRTDPFTLGFGDAFGISGSYLADLYLEMGLTISKHSAKGYARFGDDVAGEITLSPGAFNYTKPFHHKDSDITFESPALNW